MLNTILVAVAGLITGACIFLVAYALGAGSAEIDMWDDHFAELERQRWQSITGSQSNAAKTAKNPFTSASTSAHTAYPPLMRDLW